MSVSAASFVVPPGQEALIQQMVNPASGLPTGWQFVTAKVLASEIVVFYRHQPEGATARITLHHRESAAAANGRLTEQFAVFLQASQRLDSLGDLFAAVDAAIRAKEEQFKWLHITPFVDETQAAPPPERAHVAPLPQPAATTPAMPVEPERNDSQVDVGAILTEIDEHLELVPWIDLGVTFDHQSCFEEAAALHDRYVKYQSDPSYNVTAWRSLALRALDGNAGQSATPEGEAANDETRYKQTEIAALCPRTMSFLDQIVDVDHCRVITYLALEPGGRIAPHTDDTQHVVMHSVNIALNMPTGCEFFIETNPDGSSNPYTQIAPLHEGHTLLMNVARYHYVNNGSAVRRIHLNARGPLRIPPERVLELARKQNGFSTREELLSALEKKRRDPQAMVRPAHLVEADWRAAQAMSASSKSE